MKRVLIKENTALADVHIKELKDKAQKLTELVSFYNEISNLKSITTEKQVKDFLSNPVQYFDNAIINDLEITFSKRAALKPEMVAKMVGIDYNSVVNKIYETGIANLDVMDLNPENLSLNLNEGAIKDIYESSKEYAKDEREAEALLYVRDFCLQLNKFCEFMGADAYSVNKVAQNLNLDTIGKVNGYEITENIYKLRQRLKKLK